MPKTPRITPAPKVVEFLAFPGAQILDVTGPLQVFASANDWARRSGKPEPYLNRVVASGDGVHDAAAISGTPRRWRWRATS